MSDLTLGGNLAAPMQPDDDPSILPWQTDYRVELTLSDGAFLFASVMRAEVAHLVRGDRLTRPWSAYVAVNAEETYKGWHESAEDAKAAVAAHLTEVSR